MPVTDVSFGRAALWEQIASTEIHKVSHYKQSQADGLLHPHSDNTINKSMGSINRNTASLLIEKKLLKKLVSGTFSRLIVIVTMAKTS